MTSDDELIIIATKNPTIEAMTATVDSDVYFDSNLYYLKVPRNNQKNTRFVLKSTIKYQKTD